MGALIGGFYAAGKLDDPAYFAAMMLSEGEADSVLGGLSTAYPDTIRPALQILPLQEGRTIVSAIYVVVVGGRAYAFLERKSIFKKLALRP